MFWLKVFWFCRSQVPDAEYVALYCRFVDDCWAYFADQDCALEFERKLDNLHPALKFTCEFILNASLSFLDVLVERVVDVTTVYRKPTFTGMCLQWDSFCSVKYKIALNRCLGNRALRICSVEKLSRELDFLRDMFLRNGYPAGIVNKYITTDLTIGRNLDWDGANRCILCLPYVGADNLDIERRVCSVVGRAFGEVNVVTVYITGRAFMVKKDILPSSCLSKSFYSFECRHCDSRYVGRTIQHLHARIRRYVPLHLLPPEARNDRPRRGRPRKVHATRIDTGEVAIEHQPTGVSAEKECKTFGLERIGCVHWKFYKS